MNGGVKKVAVAAGGTGGHIFPALAVAEEMRRLGKVVLFVGGVLGPEADRARSGGFDFLGIEVTGFDRRSVLKSAKALLMLPKAVAKARKGLLEFKPDAVIGCGGYASAPLCLAAAIEGTPLFLMEQNVYPGLVTRWLAKRAEKVYASFQETTGYLKGDNLVVSGNPTRAEFFAPPKRNFDAPGKTLLVMGGSQGAATINRAMIDALPRLSGMDIRIFHQTGTKDAESTRAAYSRFTPPSGSLLAVIEPFFEDMAEKMRKAHLVVARAGASSCAEMLLSALPSILVPFPGAGGHQKYNALALENCGASVVVDDADLSGELLAEKITAFFRRPHDLERMSAQAGIHARPNVAKFIYEDVLSTIGAEQ